MDPTRFDNLARSLVQPASRRSTLGLVGGAALALVGTAQSDAKRRHRHGTGTHASASGGNSACAHFCAQVFGADTPAAGQCTSDAAHGKGLCYQCGPASNGKQKLCGATCIPTSGCCTNADCTLPQTCAGGGAANVCGCTPVDCTGKPCTADNGCGGTCGCPHGQTCLANNTCAVACSISDQPCPSGCGVCTPTPSDAGFCSTNGGGVGSCNGVTPDSCPQGQFCATGACFVASCTT